MIFIYIFKRLRWEISALFIDLRCSSSQALIEQEMSKSKKGAGCMLIFRKSSVIYEGLTFWNVQYYGTSTLKNNVFLVTCESYAQQHKHGPYIISEEIWVTRFGSMVIRKYTYYIAFSVYIHKNIPIYFGLLLASNLH